MTDHRQYQVSGVLLSPNGQSMQQQSQAQQMAKAKAKEARKEAKEKRSPSTQSQGGIGENLDGYVRELTFGKHICVYPISTSE